MSNGGEQVGGFPAHQRAGRETALDSDSKIQGDPRAPTQVARIAALDSVFDHYYRTRPVTATFTGVHDYDRHLPDWSATGVERAAEELRACRALLARQGAGSLGDDVLAARDWTGIDCALSDSFLEIQTAELEGRHFQRGNPSLVIGEAVFGIIALMIRDFAPVPERARAARARLAELPRFLDSALAVIAEAPVPATWTERALRECDGARALLSGGIDRWRELDGIPPDLRSDLRRAADVALGAVESFAAGLPRLAADVQPARACGREMLELLLRRGHWCNRGVDELLRDARERFREAKAQLLKLARALDDRGPAGVQEDLAATHPAPASYYCAFQEVWEACRARTASLDLVTWPDLPVRYVPLPEWTRKAAPFLYYLFYRSPAPFDHSDLYEYVVPPIDELHGDALKRHLRSWNDSVIKLNHVVHHGAIGHHVQNWHAARAPSRIGRIAAVDGASRIGMFLGGTMAEGWACYATDLMEEAGFFTPAERFAEQQTRVRMLARAIVDIEFHTGARSFEEAVRLYEEEVGMPAAAARAEVIKNSMFPGTALMYDLGTSMLHGMRSRRRLRTGFDMKSFHDELLSYGSLPVALIDKLMA